MTIFHTIHLANKLGETEMIKRLTQFYQKSLRLLASRKSEHIQRYIFTWLTYIINPLLWIVYGLCSALIPFGGLPQPYGFSIFGIGVLAIMLFAMLIFSQIRIVFISREQILSDKEREQLITKTDEETGSANKQQPLFKLSKLDIFDTVLLLIMIVIFGGSLFMCIYPYVATNLDNDTRDILLGIGFVFMPLTGFSIITWLMYYLRSFLLRNV